MACTPSADKVATSFSIWPMVSSRSLVLASAQNVQPYGQPLAVYNEAVIRLLASSSFPFADVELKAPFSNPASHKSKAGPAILVTSGKGPVGILCVPKSSHQTRPGMKLVFGLSPRPQTDTNSTNDSSHSPYMTKSKGSKYFR